MTEKEKEYRTERLLSAMKERNAETRNCLTTTELGRPLGMTASEVYKELCRLGILYYGQPVPVSTARSIAITSKTSKSHQV